MQKKVDMPDFEDGDIMEIFSHLRSKVSEVFPEISTQLTDYPPVQGGPMSELESYWRRLRSILSNYGTPRFSEALQTINENLDEGRIQNISVEFGESGEGKFGYRELDLSEVEDTANLIKSIDDIVNSISEERSLG